MKCKKHPTYLAKREPKSTCEVCWEIFNFANNAVPKDMPETHCGLCQDIASVPIAVISGLTLHLNPFNSEVFWPCAKEYDLNLCKRCTAGEPLAYDNRKVLLHRATTMDFECPAIERKK